MANVLEAFECEGVGLVPLGSMMQVGLQTLSGLIRVHTVPPASPQVHWLSEAHMVPSEEWAGQ